MINQSINGSIETNLYKGYKVKSPL